MLTLGFILSNGHRADIFKFGQTQGTSAHNLHDNKPKLSKEKIVKRQFGQIIVILKKRWGFS